MAKEEKVEKAKKEKENDRRVKISGLTAEESCRLTAKHGSFTKEQLDSAVWGRIQKVGATINARGKEITEDKVKVQDGAWMRDVKNQRQGWWQGYQLTELEDNKFSVVKVE